MLLVFLPGSYAQCRRSSAEMLERQDDVKGNFKVTVGLQKIAHFREQLRLVAETFSEVFYCCTRVANK